MEFQHHFLLRLQVTLTLTLLMMKCEAEDRGQTGGGTDGGESQCSALYMVLSLSLLTNHNAGLPGGGNPSYQVWNQTHNPLGVRQFLYPLIHRNPRAGVIATLKKRRH